MPDTHYLSLHGRCLHVQVADPATKAAVLTVLDYHGFSPASAGTATWTLAPNASAEVSAQATLVAGHASGLHIWQDGEGYALVHENGVLRIEPETGLITGSLPISDNVVSEQLYVTLTFAILLLLENEGWYALHAACLVTPEGHGVLVVGPSDSGKSTMALHLVQQGWQYLSDDSVLLYKDGDSVSVRPLRRDFCLDPDAEALFPVLGDSNARMLTDADKWRVQIESLFPTQRMLSCTPRLLIFPTVAGTAESKTSALRGIEALMRLLPQASLLRRDPKHALPFSHLLKHLVEQAPAHQFLSGTDVHHDGARLATLLTSLLPAPYANAAS